MERIAESELVTYERIGGGAYGDVYRAVLRSLHVAVKRVRPQFANAFRTEVRDTHVAAALQ